MSKKIDEKELYRLWWEYSKRSEGFKISYDWHCKSQDGIKTEMPEILKSCNRHTRLTILITCSLFEGLHAKPFDDWWEIERQVIKTTRKIEEANSISNYIDIFQSDFDECVGILKNIVGREPTLNEFKNFFVKYLMNRPFHKILAVDLKVNKIDVLRKAFDQIIRHWKKDLYIKFWGKEIRCPGVHSTIEHAQYNKLKRYLAVYDLIKNGLKYQEIVEKIGMEEQKKYGYDPDLERQFRRDVQLARRIIKNAVLGRFPLMTKLPLSKYPFLDLA